MKTQETLYSKLWKAGIVYGLMGLALYWAWIVGGSFIHLTMFLYEHLGVRFLIEGFCLLYIMILLVTIIFVSMSLRLRKTYDDVKTKKYCRIALSMALIPGVSLLLPLMAFTYGIMKIGINGAAFIIVLFETVYGDEKETPEEG